jgi:hypothetical protein
MPDLLLYIVLSCRLDWYVVSRTASQLFELIFWEQFHSSRSISISIGVHCCRIQSVILPNLDEGCSHRRLVEGREFVRPIAVAGRCRASVACFGRPPSQLASLNIMRRNFQAFDWYKLQVPFVARMLLCTAKTGSTSIREIDVLNRDIDGAIDLTSPYL